MAVSFSAVRLEFLSKTFNAAVRPFTHDAFDVLRADDRTFVYRPRETDDMLVVPIGSSASVQGASPLLIANHMQAMAALLTWRLPALLPDLGLHRRRFGLERIRDDDDLVTEAFQRAKFTRPERLEGVRRLLKTTLTVRRIYLAGEGDVLCLTVELHRRLVLPSVGELLQRGFDLRGLSARERTDQPRPDWPDGVIAEQSRDEIKLETENGVRALALPAVHLEPNLGAYSRLLEQALSPAQIVNFRVGEWAAQAEVLSGQRYADRMKAIGQWFAKRPALEVASGLTVKATGLVTAATQRREVFRLGDVKYCFSPDRSATHPYPSAGLDKFGPFDATSFDRKSPRVLFIYPSELKSNVETLALRLRGGMASDNVDRFVRGLTGIYQLAKVDVRFLGVDVSKRRNQLGTAYRDALHEYLTPQTEPDIVVVVLHDEDGDRPFENPYIHSKAFLLSQGIPSQEIRVSTMRKKPFSLAFTLENMGVAMYAKLGGTPWTVQPTMPIAREIVIGLAHAEVGKRHERKRYVGLTTVFTSDGNYLLSAAAPRCTFEEFPEMLQRSVAELLARLKVEQSWQPGETVRIVFHSSTPLRNVHVGRVAKAAVATLGAGIHFEMAALTVSRDHPFNTFDEGEKGVERTVEAIGGGFAKRIIAECVPARGTLIDLGPDECLLCVSGTVLPKREGEPVPQPLLLRLHDESSYRDLHSLARQVYHFTGLAWSSMQPRAEPVTLYYSHRIASLLARLEGVPDWHDGLLSTRLRRSRWFL